MKNTLETALKLSNNKNGLPEIKITNELDLCNTNKTIYNTTMKIFIFKPTKSNNVNATGSPKLVASQCKLFNHIPKSKPLNSRVAVIGQKQFSELHKSSFKNNTGSFGSWEGSIRRYYNSSKNNGKVQNIKQSLTKENKNVDTAFNPYLALSKSGVYSTRTVLWPTPLNFNIGGLSQRQLRERNEAYLKGKLGPFGGSRRGYCIFSKNNEKASKLNQDLTKIIINVNTARSSRVVPLQSKLSSHLLGSTPFNHNFSGLNDKQFRERNKNFLKKDGWPFGVSIRGYSNFSANKEKEKKKKQQYKNNRKQQQHKLNVVQVTAWVPKAKQQQIKTMFIQSHAEAYKTKRKQPKIKTAFIQPSAKIISIQNKEIELNSRKFFYWHRLNHFLLKVSYNAELLLGGASTNTNNKWRANFLMSKNNIEIFNAVAVRARLITLYAAFRWVSTDKMFGIFYKRIRFMFASHTPVFANLMAWAAIITAGVSSSNRWLPGRVSAQTNLKFLPNYLFIPDPDENGMITREAWQKKVPVIAINNSDSKYTADMGIYGNNKSFKGIVKLVGLLVSFSNDKKEKTQLVFQKNGFSKKWFYLDSHNR